MSALREFGNTTAHIAGGAAIALVACWNLWMLVPGALVYGWLREQAQHRYKLDSGFDLCGPNTYYVEKRTFFDFSWVTPHRAWEASQWAIGAAISVGIWECKWK